MSTVSQSVLSSKAGPRPIQLLFNLGAISVFSTFAYRVYHSDALAAIDCERSHPPVVDGHVVLPDQYDGCGRGDCPHRIEAGKENLGG